MGSKTNPQQLSIKRLKNTSFNNFFKKLILKEDLEPEELIKLLSVAIILANQNKVELNRLAYKIVLIYGNLTNDYIPLYDISINTGLMPVADLIKKLMLQEGKKITNSTFINEFTDSLVDTFKDENITYTEQQRYLNEFFKENIHKTLSIVAPTSYGKSELIISAIKHQPNNKFCILVPSKSLLSQTKKRVLDAKINWTKKIITHPEMHEKDCDEGIYILTQERLSRLLNIDPSLSFDFLFVDEAHNLLDKTSRNELLAAVISIIKHRNPNTSIKFLTPFLKNTDNLHLRHVPNSELNFFIDEYVKSELFYTADFKNNRKEFNLYEQFTDQFYETNFKSQNAVDYIIKNASQKNIIYFNKPKDIEKFVLSLIKNLEPIEDNDINTAIQELQNNIHNEYTLIECLKKGVVYHHGSMTDNVRNYVEYLFRKSKKLKYLVSSSTLLEGVNMPIERLFMMDIKKGLGHLTPSQFKNLIGRVNRFNEIFSEIRIHNLNKLEPEIHIISTDEYNNTDIKKFIKSRANVLKKIKEVPENVLLEKTEITELNKKNFEAAISRLENLEIGIVENYEKKYLNTEVGKLLIANNVTEINVFDKEEEIQKALSKINENSISTSNELMNVIYLAFIKYLDEDTNENELSRLRHKQAQSFYAMMIDWKISKTPLKLMIRSFLDYWDSLYKQNPNALVYVGKWGDETNNKGFRELYTKINNKTRKEKINLAIVRIKEEEDYIEHILFRFIDVLNDLNLLDEMFYKSIKYGTTNENTIKLIRHGLSRSVAELIMKKYSNFVQINNEKNIVQLNPKLYKEMNQQGESFLQLFEVQMNTGNS